MIYSATHYLDPISVLLSVEEALLRSPLNLGFLICEMSL